ncbi:VOC family protein [Aurantivibrio plasticivorans]
MRLSISLSALFLSLSMTAFSERVVEQGHFHHVRLNVQDVEETRTFYQQFLGATAVNFNNKTPGLFTERSFILMNKVDNPAMSNLKTSLWHIGWSGVDGPNEYAWLKSQGVNFYTPLTPLGKNHFMYLFGPDEEVVEIYTGDKHHRFNHVHILASDVQKTTDWLKSALALSETQIRKLPSAFIVTVDNVQIIVSLNSDRLRPPEQGPELLPTDESTIAHIAFSFRDIQGAYERVKSSGLAIESDISVSALHGLPSFFARATDGILVEFVQAKPIPDGIWE